VLAALLNAPPAPPAAKDWAAAFAPMAIAARYCHIYRQISR
jgi:hypothetical protein